MLQLADIRKNWGKVKPCLEKIKAMGDVPWIPEDIYASCAFGESRLYVGRENPDAFMIVRIDEDKHTGKRNLFIWIVWGGEYHGIINKYYPFVQDLAKANECEEIRMQSPRRGFEKYGWIPAMINYVKEVR
jgi:hypothetical protein